MSIFITPRISLDESEVSESFIRSSGPGGQNVNKVSTAVQLRFDVAGSPSLPESVKQRLSTLAGKRMTRDGVLVLCAQNHRSQDRNREEALARLIALIQQAAVVPEIRRPTKATYSSHLRRLDSKSKRSVIKRLRSNDHSD